MNVQSELDRLFPPIAKPMPLAPDPMDQHEAENGICSGEDDQ